MLILCTDIFIYEKSRIERVLVQYKQKFINKKIPQAHNLSPIFDTAHTPNYSMYSISSFSLI